MLQRLHQLNKPDDKQAHLWNQRRLQNVTIIRANLNTSCHNHQILLVRPRRDQIITRKHLNRHRITVKWLLGKEFPIQLRLPLNMPHSDRLLGQDKTVSMVVILLRLRLLQLHHNKGTYRHHNTNCHCSIKPSILAKIALIAIMTGIGVPKRKGGIKKRLPSREGWRMLLSSEDWRSLDVDFSC
jgi:hypothetical protein